MKTRTLFLRSLLLGLGISLGSLAPVFADTAWNTGVTSTDNLITASNWTNGAPDLTNPGTIGSATIGVTADQTLNNTTITVSSGTITSKALYLGSESGSTTNFTLAGASQWTTSGSLVGLYNNTGTGLLNFSIKDTAKLTVSGNFWGGNAESTSAKPLTGQPYAQNYTFSGDSETTVSGEFWIGMSAKTHVLIEGNAKVTANGGSQGGLGWRSNAASSLFEMTGGTFDFNSSNQFNIQQNGTMNQSGGTANINKKLVISGGSSLNLSGTAVMTVEDTGIITNDGTINITGGTLTGVTYDGGGTANLSGGTFTATNLTNTGILNVNAGGTLSATNIGGKVVVAGGTVNPADLYVNSGSNFTINSGSVAPTATFRIGNNAGTATFNQTGGTVTFAGTNNVYFGIAAGSNAKVNLSGGTFTISSSTLYLSDNDTAESTLKMSGTAVLNTKTVSVGQHSTAVVEMSGSSQWTADGVFYTGQQDSVANATITISDSAKLTTGSMYMGYSSFGSTGKNSLTLNDSSSVRVNGSFIPLKGFQDGSKTGGTGLVELTLNDNASMYVTGNFWGGSDYKSNYVSPLAGYDYVNYFTFGGNSSLSVGEFWAGMSAKTLITIKENASVVSRNGNSGIGWDGGSADSRLDMSGGFLSAPTFYMGNTKTASMNQTGGLVTFGNLLVNTADSVLTLSDSALMIASQVSANKGTIRLEEGGTLQTGRLVNTGTVRFDGGELALAPYGYVETAGGTIEYNSGTVSMSMPTGVVFQTGDQAFLGKFASQEQADLFTSALSMAGWTIGYDGASKNLVAAYGDSVKTDLKIWKDGSSGSMLDANNWNGDASNSTGFVNSSATTITNTFSDFSGKLVVNGGTNTFNGTVAAGDVLAINGGANTYSPTTLGGAAVVNGGSFSTSGALAISSTTTPAELILSSGTTTIGGNLTTATANGSSATIALSGNARLTVNGNFIALSGNTGTGYSQLSITDNAYMKTTGNFWGGNAANTSAKPLTGKEYAQTFTFSGNSTLECGEFWIGMSAKTHVILEDNAHIKSTNNNTGIGWNDNASGSRFEQKGGTLDSVNVKIGETGLNNPTLTWLQTGGDWNVSGTLSINSPNALYSVSGSDSRLTIEGTLTNSGVIQVASGASLTAKGTIDNYKSITVSGGTILDNGTFNNKSGGTLNVNGGSFTAGTLYLNGGSTTELTGGTMTANAGIVGNTSGTVIFTQTGGGFLYNNADVRLQFGSAANSIVNLNISGGTYTSVQNMDISDSASSVVNFNLSGDAIVQAKGCSNFGRTGVANIHMTDNSSYVSSGVWLYLGGDTSEGKTSTLDMSGSSRLTSNTTTIGKKGNGTAVIGGSALFAPASLTVGDGGTGTLTVKESGTTKTSSLTVNAKGSVAVEGGLIDVASMTNKAATTVSGGTIQANTYTNSNSGTTTVSGAGTIQANTFVNEGLTTVAGGTIQANTFTNSGSGTLTVSGGTLQTSYLNQTAGTTNLSGGAIALRSYGMINAAAGTFNSNSGAITVSAPTNLTYTTGDQILVGVFADAAAATSAQTLVSAPTGWTAATIGSRVVLGYGAAPTDLKVWKPGTSGSMATADNWTGTAANSTGFVQSGTNTFTDFSGKVVVEGGANTFNATIPAGQALVVNGGTNTITQNSGTLIINNGTVSRSDSIRTYGTVANPAYTEINGGALSTTAWLAVGDEADTARKNPSGAISVNGGTVSANGMILADHKNTWGDYKQTGGTVTIASAGLMIAGQNPTTEDKSGTKGTFQLSGGTITVNGSANLAQSTGSQATLSMTGGAFNGQALNLGRADAGTDAVVNISGGTMTLTKTVSGGGQLKISGTGALTINSSEAGDEITGLSLFELAGEGTNRSGALRFLQSGSINVSPTLTADAAIRVESGATVDLLQPVWESVGANATLTKRGTGTLNLGVAGSTVSALNVAEGTLAMANIDYSGPVSVGSTGTLKVSNTSPGTFRAPVTSAGTVLFESGTTNVIGSYLLDGGTFQVDSDATINIGEPGASSGQNLTISGTGTFDFNGDLVINAYGPYDCDSVILSGLVGDKSFGSDSTLTINILNPELFDVPYVELAWIQGFDNPLELQSINWNIVGGEGIGLSMDERGYFVAGDRNLVPEPSTWALLLLGILGVAYLRRRRG